MSSVCLTVGQVLGYKVEPDLVLSQQCDKDAGPERGAHGPA